MEPASNANVETIQAGTDGFVSAIPGDRSSASAEAIVLHHIVDSNSALMKSAYNKILQTCFSRPGELDDLSSIRSYLRSNDPAAQYDVIVATQGRATVGVTAFATFGSPIGAFTTSEYTAVAESHRRLQIGTRLGTARIDTARLRAIKMGHRGLDFAILVADSPQGTKPILWRRLGYGMIDFPFVPLPLHDRESVYLPYDLMFRGFTPPYTSRLHRKRCEIWRIILACNWFRVVTTHTGKDSRYREMLSILATTKQFSVER